MNQDPAEGGENKENEEDPSKKSPPEPREYVVTGGVDDIVKVWKHSDGELRLKNKLTDHSLGKYWQFSVLKTQIYKSYCRCCRCGY